MIAADLLEQEDIELERNLEILYHYDDTQKRTKPWQFHLCG